MLPLRLRAWEPEPEPVQDPEPEPQLSSTAEVRSEFALAVAQLENQLQASEITADPHISGLRQLQRAHLQAEARAILIHTLALALH